MEEIGAEKFDVIISLNAFEHYSDPAYIVAQFTELLGDDGMLVIAFAPLWKSPFGGHIGFMTKVPWAHLLFPERIIMNERRRLLPDENAQRFEDVIGGLNKMTLAKFRKVMGDAELECLYCETNVSDKRIIKMVRLLSKVPLWEEFLTHNLYSVWRRRR